MAEIKHAIPAVEKMPCSVLGPQKGCHPALELGCEGDANVLTNSMPLQCIYKVTAGWRKSAHM